MLNKDRKARIGVRKVSSQLADIMRKPIKNNNIILLGDSITNRNLNNGMPSSEGYFTNANILMGQKFNLLKCAGVPGENIEQISARLQTDVLNYDPSYCFVLAGINNALETASSIMTKLRTLIWQPLLNSGIIVIASTITPNNSSTAVSKASICQVNDMIRHEASKVNGMICVDFARAVTDGKTGNWRTGFSDDGLHPNTRGAIYMAREVVSVLSFIPRIYSNDYYGGLNDPLSLVGNSMMFGNNANGVNGFVTGTNVTGAGANSWVITGTASSSAVCTGSQSRGDHIDGEALKLECTFGANDDIIKASPSGGDIYIDRAWAATTAKKIGDVVRPTAGRSGYVYKCITFAGGSTGSTQPTWTTNIGDTVVDGAITWLCIADVVTDDVYIMEADIMITAMSAGALIYPSLNLNTQDSSFANIFNSSKNGVDIIPFGASISAPFVVTGTNGESDYFPLNQIITLKSNPILLNTGIFSHIAPVLKIFGKSGNTCTLQILRFDLRKVVAW